MFIGIGHLPDRETGEIVKVIFRHSMYENVCDGSTPILAYIPMGIMLISILLNVVNLKCNHKKLQTLSNTVFWVAIAAFAILLFYASTVARGY